MNKALTLSGIGLRPPHVTRLLETRPKFAWLEVHSENYFASGGPSVQELEQVRQHYPVSLHGVGLSLGSTDALNWQHLKKLRDLVSRTDPCLISEHVSWSSIDGHYFHDLLPLPYTEEALAHLVERIRLVQDFLGRQILIENISAYMQFPHSTIPEWEFLRAVAEQASCGILLDINNIYVSAHNLDFSPQRFIQAIPAHLVQELHLAGHTTTTINQSTVLIDSHNQPVTPAVWSLYQHAIKHLGIKPTIIEWDTDLPLLETLYDEAAQAEQIMREIYATTKLTS